MSGTKSAKKLCFDFDDSNEDCKVFDVDMEVEDAEPIWVRKLNLFDNVDEEVY